MRMKQNFPGYAVIVTFLVAILSAPGCDRTPPAQPKAAVPNHVPEFQGVWISPLLSMDDPRWRIEDLVCARTGCSMASYDYLRELLDDPANDDRHLRELDQETQEYNQRTVSASLTAAARKQLADYDPADDPVLECKPDGDGLRHQILAPLPVQIEQFDDRIVLTYEYWNAARTAYMDGRGHPQGGEPTRLGHSIGYYDGTTLVIETAQIRPNLIGVPGGAIRHSSSARAVERYTVSEYGSRLDLEWAILDPENFSEPLTGQRSYLLSPDWELEDFVCEAKTGEF